MPLLFKPMLVKMLKIKELFKQNKSLGFDPMIQKQDTIQYVNMIKHKQSAKNRFKVKNADMLYADVISFFITRKCQKIQEMDEK